MIPWIDKISNTVWAYISTGPVKSYFTTQYFKSAFTFYYTFMVYVLQNVLLNVYAISAVVYKYQIYSNKKVTSDFHDTVSINPVKMLQQK